MAPILVMLAACVILAALLVRRQARTRGREGVEERAARESFFSDRFRH